MCADIIKDAGTQKLSTQQKIKYMEALHLNERERLVIHEGGIIIGREEGRAEGIAIGRAEGKAETQARIARNLLKMGMPVEEIAKATSLSEEQIAALK